MSQAAPGLESQPRSHEVLEIVEEYLQTANILVWLQCALQDLVTENTLPYNPYCQLLQKCIATATLSSSQHENHARPIGSHVHTEDQLPMGIATYSGSLGETAFGLPALLSLTSPRALRTCSAIAQEIQATWKSCVKSSLPFETVMTADFPCLWGLSQQSSTQMALSCDCIMRGIGPEDGRRIFVSIFQKFVGKLSSESHTLLWVNIADRRITSTEVQSKEGGEHILDALVKETPLTLLSLIRDQQSKRVYAYQLSLGLCVVANQMDKCATFTSRPPHALLLKGAFFSIEALTIYLDLFQEDYTNTLVERVRKQFSAKLEQYKESGETNAGSIFEHLLMITVAKLYEGNSSDRSQQVSRVSLQDAQTSLDITDVNSIKRFHDLLHLRFIDVEALIQEVSLVLALKQLQNVPKTAVITEAIGNICENVITFYEGIDQIGVSENLDEIKLLCSIINSTNQPIFELERLQTHLLFSKYLLREPVMDEIFEVGANQYLIDTKRENDEEFKEDRNALQHFDIHTPAWGAHGRLHLDMKQIVKASRLPQNIRRSVIIAQYLYDIRLDFQLRKLLLEIVSRSELPENPYSCASISLCRAMWETELLTEPDVRLISRCTRNDPQPTKMDSIFALGQATAYGRKETLHALSTKAVSPMMALVLKAKTPPLARTSEAEFTTAIWITGKTAFSMSYRSVVCHSECFEHTHIVSSRRVRALEIFVDHLHSSILDKHELLPIIVTPGVSWTIEDIQSNEVEFKGALQFSLQARESLQIRLHCWTGHHFVSIQKHISISISNIDGSVLLAPTSSWNAISVHTAVFPLIEDAATAMHFPDVADVSMKDMLKRIGEEIRELRIRGGCKSIMEKLVERSCLNGDWSTLPSLVRYFSSAWGALMTCEEILSTLNSLQMLQLDSQVLVQNIQVRKSVTQHQAFGLLRHALSHHAFLLPQSLQGHILGLLLQPTITQDHIRLVQDYLHVLMNVAAKQMYNMMDDIRELARICDLTYRSVAAKTENKLMEDQQGENLQLQSQNLPSNKMSKKRNKHLTLADNYPSSWDI